MKNVEMKKRVTEILSIGNKVEVEKIITDMMENVNCQITNCIFNLCLNYYEKTYGEEEATKFFTALYE
jgi:hypothetical protein